MANQKKKNIIARALERFGGAVATPLIKYQSLKRNKERIRMIDKAAEKESVKILEKLNKSGKFVGTTKLPGGTPPTSWGKREETLKKVSEQVKKVRRAQYKKKGLID